VLNLVYLNTDYYGPTGATGGETPSESPIGPVEHPTIDVIMQVSTAAPEARRFLSDTVTTWLRENAKREGVPYEIVYSTEFKDQDAARSEERPRPGRAGREEQDGRGEARPRSGRAPARPEGAVVREGGGSTGGEGIEQLAPIGPDADQVPPPTVNRVLAFQLVFKPPAPPAEGEAAGGAGSAAGQGGGN
jgi:hypothetical protein